MRLDDEPNSSVRVLVTGCHGFTGQHLCLHLRSLGYEVWGMSTHSLAQANHIPCNLLDETEVSVQIAKLIPTHVVHLAAISFVGDNNNARMYDVNVVGTTNLLKALSELSTPPQKVIIASSATVYGDQGLAVLDESLCPQPVNHYGCSKLAMEHIARTFQVRLPIVITRPFNYTGVGQVAHFLIPKIVQHYQQGKKVIELGNLHVEREFNDIADICALYEGLLFGKADSQTVNLCTGRGIALMNVIHEMNSIAGYEMQVSINPAFVRANEIPKLIGSKARLESLLGRAVQPRPLRETLLTMFNGV